MSITNVLDRIIAFETGELDEAQTIDLFQHLVDTGEVWHLQGFYGRFATDLIEQGLVTRKEECPGGLGETLRKQGLAPALPGC